MSSLSEFGSDRWFYLAEPERRDRMFVVKHQLGACSGRAILFREVALSLTVGGCCLQPHRISMSRTRVRAGLVADALAAARGSANFQARSFVQWPGALPDGPHLAFFFI
jgi:hypothetical protein